MVPGMPGRYWFGPIVYSSPVTARGTTSTSLAFAAKAGWVQAKRGWVQREAQGAWKSPRATCKCAMAGRSARLPSQSVTPGQYRSGPTDCSSLGTEDSFFNGIGSQTWSTARGDAGQVEVTAGDLQVRNGGAISTATYSSGSGGVLSVHADHLLISGDGRIDTAISSEAWGIGPGGAIAISATDTLRLDNAAIRAQTETATGGDIMLAAGRLFDLHNSTVTTSVAGGTGSGGNIF